MLIIAAIGIFIVILVIAAYIAEGILLYKLNKLMYGKGTPLAWIPICNTYLLGKLTVNKIVGWILVACMFLTANFTITINGVETTKSLLPASIVSVLSPIYSMAVFGLLIYAIIKYVDLKKKANSNQIFEANNQNMGNSYQNVQTNFVEPTIQNTNISTPIDSQSVTNNVQQNSFESSNQNVNPVNQPVNPQPNEQNSVFNNIQANPIGSTNPFQSVNSQVEPTINPQNVQNAQNLQPNSIFNSTPNDSNPQIPQDSIFNSVPTMPQENSENNNFINQG